MRGLVSDLAGRIGPPLLAGTTVACLLMGRFEWLHGVLFLAGVALLVAHYRLDGSR